MADLLRRPDGAGPRVLVAGGGVAALELVLALRALAGSRVAIELIAPDAELRYPPLDVVAPFGLTPPRVQLAELLAPLGVSHRVDALIDVDPVAHRTSTRQGATLAYEALVLAIGARALSPTPGMLAFGGPGGGDRFGKLLRAAEAGQVDRLLFAVPPSTAWPLPLYELAIMTRRHLRVHGSRTRVTIVTPEQAPLELFGGRPSGRLLEYLESLGIAFVSASRVEQVLRGEVLLAPGGRRIRADRVVTLPTLTGPRLPGVPYDADGFIAVDPHGAVRGAHDLYAAGDATDFRIKHGGLATQQADAVAEAIAARCGVPLEPAPFRPVLRGMLLTGEQPHYLEAGVEGAHPDPADALTPLWWPPVKVAGRHLAPYLASKLGVEAPSDPAPPEGWTAAAVPCELPIPVGKASR